MHANRLREKLVRQLREADRHLDERIAAAFLAVPRDGFLPGFEPEAAYADRPLVTRRDAAGQPISSSSQPSIMSAMLAQLDVVPGSRVLEIGAGTGYNAALLAELTGSAQLVTTVDIDPEIAREATNNLTLAGYPDVLTVCTDGAFGYPEDAPYDRIIATVGVRDIEPYWLEQLAGDGILLLPIDLDGVHRSIAFARQQDHLASKSIVDCGFMRMRGVTQGPEVVRTIDPARGLSLLVYDGEHVEALAASLNGVPTDVLTGVSARAVEVLGGLLLWLTWAGLRRVDVYEDDDATPPVLGATHVDWGGARMAPGMAGSDSLALLIRADGAPEIVVRAFGPDATALSAELAGHVRDWHAAGRPSTTDLQVRAYPTGAENSTAPCRIVRREHSSLVLSWQR